MVWAKNQQKSITGVICEPNVSKQLEGMLSVDASVFSNLEYGADPVCMQWLAFSFPHNRQNLISLFFLLIQHARRFKLSQTVDGPVENVLQ